MTQSKEKSLPQSLLENIFNAFLNLIGAIINKFANAIVDVIFYLLSKLKAFLQYHISKLFTRRGSRIIYGKTKGKLVYDYAINRNQQTYIKGKPGFGKSALAVNLALQNIDQGTAGIFIDPHGYPHGKRKQMGASIEIYTRAKDISNVIFLSVNQRYKVIGTNPLFLLGDIDLLDNLKDELLNSIFYDSLEEGYQVASRAKFVLESAVYFHSAYFEWLVKVKGKNILQVKAVLQNHQITINDLAHLEDNPALIDLFIEILGFQGSKYYRPDLVAKWQKIKDKEALDSGLQGVIGRLEKIVATTKAQYFFESSGFNLIEERKKGKFVLCDISRLDKFTIEIITKLIFVKVFLLHLNGILTDQTEFYIDEASNAELPNADLIISQGRKFQLAFTLIFQYTRQFKNPRIVEAIRKAVVNKINFRNEEPDFNSPMDKITSLQKREFLMENSKGLSENVITIDMPSIQRRLEFTERGIDKEYLRQRIIAKRSNILAYFLSI